MDTDQIEANLYNIQKPDMQNLKRVFEMDVMGNTDFRARALDSANQRRMLWPGKTEDQRKNYPGAVPYTGASDLEVPVVEQKTSGLVAITMNAIRSAQITAVPVGHQNLEAATLASSFARWMMDCWIPKCYDEIELGVQNLFETGIGAIDVGWEKKTRTTKQVLFLEDMIAAAVEDEGMEAFVVAVQDFGLEDQAVEILQEMFLIRESDARRAVRNLRESGIAEIQTARMDIDRPTFITLDSSAELILPAYTMHAQKAARMHTRYFMSAQDLLQHANDSGWDKSLVQKIIEENMGITRSEMDTPLSAQDSAFEDAFDLVEIIRTFRRLIDKRDGSVGIYETVWCSSLDAEYGPLKHELLTDWDEFPVAVTSLFNQNKRLYSNPSIPQLLRGNQKQQKNIRDAMIDQISITLNPPRAYPSSRPPANWGAGATFAERATERGINRILELPNMSRPGTEIEKFLMDEADRISGLKSDDPVALSIQQYFVDRALAFIADAVRLAYKRYLREHEDPSVFFRVTGQPDPMEIIRGPIDEEMAFRMIFDVRTSDVNYIDKIISRIVEAKSVDTTGRMDPDGITDVIVSLAIPQYAGRLLRSTEEAQASILKKVADDLAIIWSGQQVGAQPNAFAVAMPYLQQYMEKQSVQRRMAEDSEFAEALQLYVGQYEQEAVQAQNAETGRLGTQAAELQGINT